MRLIYFRFNIVGPYVVVYAAIRIICLLFRFYGISIFEGYLMPNPFYTNKQFYFKQFSLAYKNFCISNNSV